MAAQVSRTWSLGIDIGTSHIRAAVYRDNGHGAWRAELIPDADGSLSMPAHLGFDKYTQARLFGETARKRAAKNAGRTVYGVKSLLGYPVPDEEMDAIAFKIINEPGGRGTPSLGIKIGKVHQYLWPVQVLGMLLSRVKRNAEAYLGGPANSAVVNVPSCFTREQRHMIQDAAEIAGFQVFRMLASPAGVLGARSLEQLSQPLTEINVMAIDVGASFTNIGIATLEDRVIDVKATESDRIGGNDFDGLLWRHFRTQAKAQGIDIYESRQATEKLRNACETAKKELSVMSKAEFSLVSIVNDKTFKGQITRAEFEKMCDEMFRSITSAIARTLKEARLTNRDIHEVVAVGGSYRIPKLRKQLEAFFGREARIRYLNPQETEVTGLASMAAQLAVDQSNPASIAQMPPLLLMLLTTRWGIGLETAGGKMATVLPPHSTIPTYGRVLITWDTEEKRPKLLSRDRSPPSAPSPRRKPGPAPIQIYEGDDPKTRDNTWLGTIDINSILPEIIHDGFKIEVSFDIDADFQLSVTMRDPATNKSVSRELNTMGKMKPLEKAQMVMTESTFHGKDVEEVLRLKARNLLEGQVAKLVDETEGQTHTLAQKVKEARAWLDRHQAAPGKEYQKRHGELMELAAADWTPKRPEKLPKTPPKITPVQTPVPEPTPTHANDSLPPKVKATPIKQAPKQAINVSAKPPKASNRKGPQPAMVEDAVSDDAGVDAVVEGSQRFAKVPALDGLPNADATPAAARINDDRTPSDYRPPSFLSLVQNGNDSTFPPFPGPGVPKDDAETIRPNPAAQQKGWNGDRDPALAGITPPVPLLPMAGAPGPPRIPRFPAPYAAVSAPPPPPSFQRPSVPSQDPAGPAASAQALLPQPHQIPKTPYKDADFERISTYLRLHRLESWSTVPRLYTVLQLLDRLDALDVFIQNGITDMWFPFDAGTLPPSLQPSTKADFLAVQRVAYADSKAHMLETGARRHVHFDAGDELPYRSVAVLGQGAQATVDKVVSTISWEEYARKIYRKPKVGRRTDMSTFKTELDILKRVRHKHCVSLVSTYADPKHFAIIMHPVGDCILSEFYALALADDSSSSSSRDRLSLLRSFFGCLAKAVEYLHGERIRHRDIKPQNVIVRADKVYLADFGIAYSWEHLVSGSGGEGGGATTVLDSGKTKVYAAPEVMRVEPRNEAADVWSLGCVFLEMATVLKGVAPSAMREYFAARTGSHYFFENVAAGVALGGWAEGEMRGRAPKEDDVAFEWAARMLRAEPGERITAAGLYDLIAGEAGRSGRSYYGTCCRDDFETLTAGVDDQETLWDF